MKAVYSFLWAVLLAAGLLVVFLLLAFAVAGCASEQAALSSGPQLFAQATDTSTAAVPLPARGKYKFKGPVTVVLQNGASNTASFADNRKAGQRQGSAATAPAARSSNASKAGGVPWWVFVLVGVLSIVGWDYLTHWLNPLKWLPAHPGTG